MDLKPSRCKQFSSGNFQRRSDLKNGHDSRVLLSPLNRAHVRAVETASVRQLFLRQIERTSGTLNGIAEGNQACVVGKSGRGYGHPPMLKMRGRNDHGRSSTYTLIRGIEERPDQR